MIGKEPILEEEVAEGPKLEEEEEEKEGEDMQVNEENEVEEDGQVTEDNEGEKNDDQAEEEVKEDMEMDMEEDWVDETLDGQMDELPWHTFTDHESPHKYVSFLSESREVPVPSSEQEQQQDLNIEAVALPEVEVVSAPNAVHVEGVPSPRPVPIEQYQTPRPLGKRTPVDAVKAKVSKEILYPNTPLDISIPHVPQSSKFSGATGGEGT